MPEIIQFKKGNQIRNKYNAAGQKLSSRNITVEAGVYQPLNPGDIIENPDVNENDNVTVEGMDHIGNMEYYSGRYFDWDVTFEPVEYHSLYRIHNPEGYATSATTSNGPIYYYYRRDHLGNNREVWRASYTWGSTTYAAATVQRTQYYPSGLPWKYNSGDNPGSQPYKYNGKEFVEMHGLDEYDSEARWYYPAIMRTTTLDPLAEKYYSISPYAWCGNNPVKFVDPDGMEITFWIYEDGKKRQVKFSELDSNIQRALEKFAKTEVGFSFLKQFAKEGQEIGSVKFSEDGIHSNHKYAIKQNEDITSNFGKSDALYKKEGIEFSVFLNPKRKNNNINNITITIAHENFIHLNEIIQKMAEFHKNRDMKGFIKYKSETLFKDYYSGTTDHSNYINKSKLTNSHILMRLLIVQDPSLKDAKNKHDETYMKYKK